MTDEPTSPDSAIIVCPLARWYYRRMGLLAAMFVVFGALFFYDWKIGYPKENRIADEKAQFEEDAQKGYDRAKAAGEENLKTWMTEAQKKGWVTDMVSPPRWDAYAAVRDLPSNPERKSQEAIDQQLHFAVGLFIGALVCGFMLLINRKRTFIGHADHMIMPDGKTVRFADVFKVDKRKWDNKALAYVYYRTSPEGPVQKAVVDDLKFDGSGKVFDRLMKNFSGELIEKLQEPDDVEAAANAKVSEKVE